MIFRQWRIATENRTWMPGNKTKPKILGCLEVCCNIKSSIQSRFTTLSLVEVCRSACHGLALTEDSRYVPDDPMMKEDENHDRKEISKGDIPEVPSSLPSACRLVIP